MKKRNVRLPLALTLAASMLLSACGGSSGGSSAGGGNSNSSANANENTSSTVAEPADSGMTILLSDGEITVNGAAIGSDSSAAVYLAQVVEVHPDVPADLTDLANKVVAITQPGYYRFSGSLTDGQICVDIADPSVEKQVIIELNGVTIDCRTSPALLVRSAYDPQTPGQSGVILHLSGDNQLSGSHIAEYTDEDGVEHDYDGAISSAVSITLTGEGSMTLNADREGIESQMHLTIDGGDMVIHAADDSLNASEDEVSVITINGGRIQCYSTEGQEGDGIDSNGSIVVNGGEVIAIGSEISQDSGLDSDLGITINGGRIVASGNMYDEVTAAGAQSHITLEFSEALAAGTPLVLLNSAEEAVFAYTPSYSARIYVVSVPELAEGESYTLYTGGVLTGTENAGFYSQIDSYEKGTQMSYSSGGGYGGFGGGGRGGPGGGGGRGNTEGFDPENMPEGREMPEGFDPENMPEGREMPEGFDPENMPEGREMPEGFDPENMPEGREMPEGGESTTGGGSSAGGGSTFTLTAEQRYFAGIRAA